MGGTQGKKVETLVEIRVPLQGTCMYTGLHPLQVGIYNGDLIAYIGSDFVRIPLQNGPDSFTRSQIRSHGHIHTHIYIYIYIYIGM